MDHILMQRFGFTRPLIIEDIETGHEVIAEPERTILRSDAESRIHDLPEMLSMAKLAEIDPLLVTFYSQPEPSEEEIRYLGMFSALCAPLKSAWIWGTMRRTVPDIYEREIIELYTIWEGLHDDLFIKGGGVINIDDSKARDTMLPMWAILTENPEYNISIKLTGGDYLPLWGKYISTIKEFISQPPDPEMYTLLPDASGAPYRARIRQDKMRYFEITKL